MTNHTSKSHLKVDGKMSESGADYVGKIQSYALLIIAISVLISALGGVAWLLLKSVSYTHLRAHET